LVALTNGIQSAYAAAIAFAALGLLAAVVLLRNVHRPAPCARRANIALLRAEPELEVPEEQIEPLAEFARSATTGLELWWAEHRDVPAPPSSKSPPACSCVASASSPKARKTESTGRAGQPWSPDRHKSAAIKGKPPFPAAASPTAKAACD
jgi:hypothetical protein